MKNTFRWMLALAALMLAGPVCFAQEAPQQPTVSDLPAPSATTAKTSDSAQTTAADPNAATQVGGSVQPPVVIHMVNPKFSKEASKAKFSGKVVVSIIVDGQGMPQNVHVKQSAGMGLDEEAVKAVKQYRFKPAMRDGRPVSVYVDVAVNFQVVSRY